MNIKILGTKGEIEASSPYHSHQSGVLIDKKLLLDLGEREFLSYKPKWIFITHLHPDHAFFIREKQTVSTKAKIYAPEKYKNININLVKPEKRIKENEYQITPIPTIHSKKVNSCCYLIQKGTKKVIYTGDMIWIKKKYHHYLKNLDLVITEGSFIRKNGLVRRDTKTGEIYGHTGIPNLLRFFRDYTDKIIFIHFGVWFFKDIKKSRQKVKSLAKKYDVEVLVGYDGLKLNLNKS